jgi:hypothetical protein
MITWGQLAKSQTDPEKIEEAIQRLINEHNADPEAHLVEGGSLKSHKMAEVIDHIARSILAEKLHQSAQVFECVVAPQGGDYTSIQAAIDDGKTRIYVKAGTYILSHPLIIKQPKTLIQGEGSGLTIIKLANNVDQHVVIIDGSVYPDLTDIQLRHLTIDGNKAYQVAGHGVFINQVSRVLIEHCSILSCRYNGIFAVDSFNCIYRFNLIRACNQNGIETTPDEADSAYNVIYGNQIESNLAAGIDSASYAELIFGNFISGLSVGSTKGIIAWGHRCLIFGNSILTHSSDGIQIYGSENSVYGNRCWNCSGYGIKIMSGASNNLVRLNYLLGNISGAMLDNGTNTRKAASTTNDNIIS